MLKKSTLGWRLVGLPQPLYELKLKDFAHHIPKSGGWPLRLRPKLPAAAAAAAAEMPAAPGAETTDAEQERPDAEAGVTVAGLPVGWAVKEHAPGWDRKGRAAAEPQQSAPNVPTGQHVASRVMFYLQGGLRKDLTPLLNCKVVPEMLAEKSPVWRGARVISYCIVLFAPRHVLIRSLGRALLRVWAGACSILCSERRRVMAASRGVRGIPSERRGWQEFYGSAPFGPRLA